MRSPNLYILTKVDSQGIKYGCYGTPSAPFADIIGVEDLKTPNVIVPNSINAEVYGINRDFYISDIVDYAFKGKTKLRSIRLPDGLKKIKRSMFDGCSSLLSANIPKDATIIESYAFDGCVAISNIVIPYGVKEIGMNAFYGCESLTSIEIPNSVTILGEEAFSHCKNLKSVIVSDNVSVIEKGTFDLCNSLEYLKLGKNIQHIDRYFLSFCYKLKTVVCNGVNNQVRVELREALAERNSGVDKWVHIQM